ncbi:MAG TPA: hypothetical protein VG713_02910, partial [Pirellulales bacterium]|nr:hypothetical protein [Pirellulales bacterium]
SMNVANLQIRPVAPTDKIEIVQLGSATAPAYRVIGRLTASGELIVPGGRFASRDRGAVKAWLDVLRTEGASRAAGGPRLPFGLPAEELARAKRDLARPVGFASNEQPALAVLQQLAESLAYPLLADPAARQAIASAGVVEDELKGLATGTAIAAVLRSAGLVFVPRMNDRRQIEYLVAASTGGESWPVGWTPTRPERDLLPGMVELANVEIDDIAASQVVDAIAGRLEVPVLYDRVALARWGIDPSKAQVTIPGSKSMYAIALRKSLFIAGLKYELRVDDAEKPMLWITSLKAL